MSFQDPIADCFTRIRNAQQVRHESVSMPASKLKIAIVELLQQEGYITSYNVTSSLKATLEVKLKYFEDKPVIAKISRVSRPGLRIYKNKDELPRVLGGLGMAIISTSKGVISDSQAREQGLGGEVLGKVE
ncbi:MAG: 30S ribosomal protein S8 [Legionellales bacterium]|nr:MAG: 30S ribosomal protein S8 [Legionellales bacterium]